MNFKPDEKNIRSLLKSGCQFVIPRFQREYSWDKKNYQEFFEDIHMGADNKGMVSFCELQCQLPADLISFFWRNFAGLKCLTEMVGDHIICTLISAGQICILSFGQKKLCISKPGITLIAINEFSKIGFLRIFYIINNI